MPRVVLLTVAVLAVLLVACQLVLPPLAERRVEERLERDGGSARVSLSSLPAPRLLFGDGDSFEASGSGLGVEVARRERVLERLDGFDEVSVRLRDLDAEPLRVECFELVRGEAEDAYEMRMAGATTPGELASFLGSEAGGLLGGALGDLAAGSLPGGGNERLPLAVAARVVSVGGQVEVTSSRSSVAGVPAGPLAELVLEAVVRRL